VCRLDYSKPGKPPIDWDDPDARAALVSALVDDALAVLAELAGPDSPGRDAAAAEALGLLALVAGAAIAMHRRDYRDHRRDYADRGAVPPGDKRPD
jgi:hypothetical protein